jgi:hypothetical protein
MMDYRLVLQDVVGAEVFTRYTRWLESVEVKESPNPGVYVAFNPRGSSGSGLKQRSGLP